MFFIQGYSREVKKLKDVAYRIHNFREHEELEFFAGQMQHGPIGRMARIPWRASLLACQLLVCDKVLREMSLLFIGIVAR